GRRARCAILFEKDVGAAPRVPASSVAIPAIPSSNGTRPRACGSMLPPPSDRCGRRESHLQPGTVMPTFLTPTRREGLAVAAALAALTPFLAPYRDAAAG